MPGQHHYLQPCVLPKGSLSQQAAESDRLVAHHVKLSFVCAFSVGPGLQGKPDVFEELFSCLSHLSPDISPGTCSYAYRPFQALRNNAISLGLPNSREIGHYVRRVLQGTAGQRPPNDPKKKVIARILYIADVRYVVVDDR